MKKFAVLAVFIFCTGIFSKDVSWYKCLKGNIGGYAVTMHLNKYNDQLGGYYYYDKYMMPFTVIGDSKGDTISLAAYMNSWQTESFNGVFKSGVYSGNWLQNDTAKKTSFKLQESAENSAMFEYVFVYGEQYLFKNYDKSPNVTYLEASVWPSDRNPDKENLRYILSKENNFPADITVIGGEMISKRDKFIKEYMKSNKDLTKNDIDDMGYTSSYNVAEEDHSNLVFLNDKLIVISNFSYLYSGGAHGNYATGYSVYDLKSLNRLRLMDVLSKEGIDELPALLEKNYRIQNAVPDTVKLSDFDLFTDTIYATENFALTPGCMMFGYPPYDIATYAAGEVKIYVPINEVEKYLKPKAFQLIK